MTTTTVWENVSGADIREGDMISVGGRTVVVERLVPYRHPVIAPEPGARIAYWHVQRGVEQGITLFPEARVNRTWRGAKRPRSAD